MEHTAIPVCVIGAGTMGRGIAQIAVAAGHTVSIVDPAAPQLASAVVEITSRLAKKSESVAETARRNLHVFERVSDAPASPNTVVIEAVLEDLDVKHSVLRQAAEHFGPSCVLATNTSSLSVTAIAAGLPVPSQTVGMHFFNPVPAMRLVEVVRGLQTDDAVADLVTELARNWGKTVARAVSTPGFIVNRVARGFYGEALRCLQEGATTPETIDEVVRGSGFRMGPFELMDLIGNDVNAAVTRSVWTAYSFDPRFAPSLLQEELVTAGRLGRKSGQGFYNYAGTSSRPLSPPVTPDDDRVLPPLTLHGADPQLEGVLERCGVEFSRRAGAGPARLEFVGAGEVVVTSGLTAAAERRRSGVPVVVLDWCLDPRTVTALAAASADTDLAHLVAQLLAAGGVSLHLVKDLPGLVVARTLAVIANEAWETEHLGVASATDIDLAMRLGTNYPAGPFEWTATWSPSTVVTLLDGLWEAYHDPRYRTSMALRAAADETDAVANR